MSFSSPLQDLFFNIYASDVEYRAANGVRCINEDYRVISRAEDCTFLGLKKCKQVDETNIHKTPYNDILLFTHREAYDLTRELYYITFRKDGECFKHYNSENINWASLFFGSQTNFQDLITENFIFWNESKHLIEVFNNQKSSILRPTSIENYKKFEPIIGVSNGYDYEDEICFYLIISVKEAKKRSLLTIADFKFSRRDQEILLKIRDPKQRLKCASHIIFDTAPGKFIAAAQAFIQNYETFCQIYVEQEDLTPICLDIYDKNRSLTSIQSDETLRNNIARLESNASHFFLHNPKSDLSSIVDFIMFDNLFDLDDVTLNRDKVEEMFVKKIPYKKSVTVFNKLRSMPGRLEEYITEQKASLKKIQLYL